MSELELRASDAEREGVAATLRDACAAGRLTLEELSERLDRLYRTKTTAELAPLTEDLPAAPAVRRTRRPSYLTAAVFGHVVRRGRIRLGRHTVALSWHADLDLDLRNAQLQAEEATVWVFVLFANADLYVPEAAETDTAGIAIFGHRRDHGRDEAAGPDAPAIRVRALSLFGTIDVWRVPAGVTGSYRDVIRTVRAADRGELTA